jgi:hypothetical protein
LRTSAPVAALALIRAGRACLASEEADHPARMATSVKIALPTMMARPRLGRSRSHAGRGRDTGLDLAARTAGGGSRGACLGVGSKGAGGSGRAVEGDGSVRLLSSGARRGRGAGGFAGGASASACALSRAARMRCRSDSDSAGRFSGLAPCPRPAPGARRGRGVAPRSSATANPPGCVCDGANIA